MADFCNQCAKEHKLPEGGLKFTCNNGENPNEAVSFEICEGCGPTYVDTKGTCVFSECQEHHGESDYRIGRTVKCGGVNL